MFKSLVLVLTPVLLVSTGSALAQTDIENRLSACMEIGDDAERLACFEAAAKSAETSSSADTSSGSVNAAPATEADPVEKQRRFFGFAGRNRPIETEEEFGLPPEAVGPESITEISAKIVKVDFRSSPGARYSKAIRIELDNGQVWRQLDSDTTKLRRFRPEVTYTAVVKKGAFSSHRMTIEPWGKIIRVRRIE